MTSGFDLEALRGVLREAGTPERARNEKRYLKSDLEFWGASVPAIRRAVKTALRGAGALAPSAVAELVARLWSEPVHESRKAAVEVAVARIADLGPADLPWIETMLREARTWAYVDPLAMDVAGPVLRRHPEEDATLDRWAVDEDFWIRRAALLTHLRPLRAGAGEREWARFTRYADAMLDEKEFFIRKAIGWVLRDAARERPGRVYDWFLARATRASGVTVREVVRRLPEPEADEVLRRYRGG